MIVYLPLDITPVVRTQTMKVKYHIQGDGEGEWRGWPSWMFEKTKILANKGQFIFKALQAYTLLINKYNLLIIIHFIEIL